MRADIVEYRKLGSLIDLDSVPFHDVMSLIVGFLSDDLQELLAECNPSVDIGVLRIIQECLDVARQRMAGRSTAETLTEARVSLWNLHDAQAEGSCERKLARIAVCALYDEESAEYETFGSGAMFETFFSVLMDLSQNCCRYFSRYVDRKMSK